MPVVESFHLPLAAVLTAFSAGGILLKPLVLNHTYDLNWIMWIRNGAPYATAGTAFVSYTGVAGLLTAASVDGRYALISHPSRAGGVVNADSPLVFAFASADPTVDGPNPGSDIELLISYQLLPTTIGGF